MELDDLPRPDPVSLDIPPHRRLQIAHDDPDLKRFGERALAHQPGGRVLPISGEPRLRQRPSGWRPTRTLRGIDYRPSRVRRRIPRRAWTALSSSPSFLAAHTNALMTAPAVSATKTVTRIRAATFIGRGKDDRRDAPRLAEAP